MSGPRPDEPEEPEDSPVPELAPWEDPPETWRGDDPESDGEEWRGEVHPEPVEWDGFLPPEALLYQRFAETDPWGAPPLKNPKEARDAGSVGGG
jgi:hypothetical protein